MVSPGMPSNAVGTAWVMCLATAPARKIFQTNQKAVTPWTRLNVAYLQEPVFAQCIRA